MHNIPFESCSVLGLSYENKEDAQIFTEYKPLPLGKSQLENNRKPLAEGGAVAASNTTVQMTCYLRDQGCEGN